MLIAIPKYIIAPDVFQLNAIELFERHDKVNAEFKKVVQELAAFWKLRTHGMSKEKRRDEIADNIKHIMLNMGGKDPEVRAHVFGDSAVVWVMVRYRIGSGKTDYYQGVGVGPDRIVFSNPRKGVGVNWPKL